MLRFPFALDHLATRPPCFFGCVRFAPFWWRLPCPRQPCPRSCASKHHCLLSPRCTCASPEAKTSKKVGNACVVGVWAAVEPPPLGKGLRSLLQTRQRALRRSVQRLVAPRLVEGGAAREPARSALASPRLILRYAQLGQETILAPGGRFGRESSCWGGRARGLRRGLRGLIMRKKTARAGARLGPCIRSAGARRCRCRGRAGLGLAPCWLACSTLTLFLGSAGLQASARPLARCAALQVASTKRQPAAMSCAV